MIIRRTLLLVLACGLASCALVEDNVLVDVAGTERAAIIVYHSAPKPVGSPLAGSNTVRGNFILRSRNEGINAAAGAIIENNIHAAHLIDHTVQELAIRLAADPYLSGLPVVLGAVRVDVDAIDRGLVTEKPAPDLKRATMVHANLQKPQRAVAERGEIAVIERNIVVPFVHRSIRIGGIDVEQIARIPVFLTDIRGDIAIFGKAEFLHRVIPLCALFPLTCLLNPF